MRRAIFNGIVNGGVPFELICSVLSELLANAIVIKHNGIGFDYSNPVNQVRSGQLHWRGRILLNELCQSIAYSNGGKSVKATYQL